MRDIKEILSERRDARTREDFDLADKLRKEAEDLGYTIRDTKLVTIASKYVPDKKPSKYAGTPQSFNG